MTTQDTPKEKSYDNEFHGAAIITEDGKEVPITEEMVLEACTKNEIKPEQDADTTE